MNKRRIPALLLLISICAAGSMYGGYNLHLLLSRNLSACSLRPATAFRGAWTIPNARLFTLLFLAASACFIGYLLLMQGYIEYRSQMRRVTPRIETPEAAGQGQYGTACWLPKAQFSQAFAAAVLDTDSAQFQQLLQEADAEFQEPPEEDTVSYGQAEP